MSTNQMQPTEIKFGIRLGNQKRGKIVTGMTVMVSTENPVIIRMLSGSGCIKNAELFQATSNGHKYAPGETRMLTGLESFPEYNGQEVKITAIRSDGSHGKAYYVEGKINEVVNWVYEYRLI